PGAATATVSPIATDRNQPPITRNINTSTAPGNVLQLTDLGGADPDGTIVSYTINTLPPAAQGVLFLGNPAQGGVAVTAGQTLTAEQINQLFFQSTGEFAGTNFTYTATDNGGAVSDRSTATIDVTGAPTPTPTQTPTPTPAVPNSPAPAPAIPGELRATPVNESEAGCDCPPLPENRSLTSWHPWHHHRHPSTTRMQNKLPYNKFGTVPATAISSSVQTQMKNSSLLRAMTSSSAKEVRI
ncbi:MAG: hypothetical protein HC849_33070, partial [Oscillatoriales cyanobacterium RU_3_3]|nr:hypothetical protein [Oscillatoriales cyanobacterium RU_3_3]